MLELAREVGAESEGGKSTDRAPAREGLMGGSLVEP